MVKFNSIGMEEVRLDRTSEGHLIQPLLMAQLISKQGQAAQVLVQFKYGDLTSSLSSLFQCSSTLPVGNLS